MLVELRPLDSIRPYPGNPRRNEAAVDFVAASIELEVWATVPGYEGLYEVSSHGRVRRQSASRMAPSGYVRKQRLTWDGYLSCSLSKRSRCWHVKTHRLVALAFLGPPPFPRTHVAHHDGDKTNNRVSNLRWATPAENEADKRRHGRVRGAPRGEKHRLAKLTDEIVIALRLHVAAGGGLKEIADRFGVRLPTASEAVRGRTWRCVTNPPPVPLSLKRNVP